jgi:2-iminoacetate synthase ThiH
MLPIPIIGSIISGVAGFFSKKQDIKKVGKIAEAKLAQAKQDGQQTVTMTDAEWESLSVQTQSGTWKDEYITIIITAPIVCILAGTIMAAVGVEAGSQVVTGATEGIKELKKLGMDYGMVLNAVVFAAVGLKLWRA